MYLVYRPQCRLPSCSQSLAGRRYQLPWGLQGDHGVDNAPGPKLRRNANTYEVAGGGLRTPGGPPKRGNLIFVRAGEGSFPCTPRFKI